MIMKTMRLMKMNKFYIGPTFTVEYQQEAGGRFNENIYTIVKNTKLVPTTAYRLEIHVLSDTWLYG